MEGHPEPPGVPMTLGPEDFEPFRTISFDVFDTILSRSVAFPTGVFDLLALEAGAHFTGIRARIPFAKARILAEVTARALSRHEEITLDEIYERLSRILRVPRGDLETLRGRELAIEEELSFGIPETIGLARRLREAGKRVLFVSDCYLPEDFVHGLLVRAGVAVERSDVYVSCQSRATKATGNLFRKIAEKEGLTLADWLHLGDNPRSDVRSPAKLGIAARLIREEGQPPFAEHRICPRATRVRGTSANPVSQILAGALRRRRVTLGAEPFDADTRLGHDLVGPLLLPYVIWVLRESVRQGIDDVFFMARDGMVLMRLAEAVVRTLRPGLRLHYLLVSRQSLNLPTLGLPGVPWDWLLESNQALTPKRLAGRLALDVEEVAAHLHEMGIHPDDSSGGLSRANVETLARRLPGSRLFAHALAQAEEIRRSTLGYLAQEGVLGPGRAALVDLGWRGTLQDRIADLADAAGYRTDYAGFYLGRIGKDFGRAAAKKAFLFDTGQGAWPALAGLQCVGFLETLTRAPHGTVLGYGEAAGRFMANLDAEPADFADVERIHAGAVRFVEEIPGSVLGILFDAPEAILRSACLRLALAVGFRPPLEEAEHVGTVKFSGEQGETPDEHLAPPLRGWRALRVVMSEHPLFPDRRTYWLAASLVRGRSRLASGAGLLLRQAIVAASLAWSRGRSKRS